ncbi:MAG: Gfo/Idh/MocA family oxidoreductase [Firmicutes bacterium]|nr:Gfo/Idh/MocA family oxidoreductase [Bacillota bacterium]
MRVAVLGCGQISPVHLKSWQNIHEAEVVVVVDIDLDKAKTRQKEFNISESETDYNLVIEREDIDVIDICLPTNLHMDAALKAARSGKHIFCEKPMARTLDEARLMQETAERHNVKLHIGFVRRFCNSWLKMKELVQSGILGEKVVWRSATCHQGAPTPWYYQKAEGAGPFLDGAVHNYDFANFMFGRIKSVNSGLFTLGSKGDAFDTGSVSLEYENGAILHMNWSWALPNTAYGGSLEDYFGANGALLYGCHGDFSYDNKTEGVITFIGKDNERKFFVYPENDMFVDEIRAFYESCVFDKPVLASAKDGIEALKVALKVLGEV